MIFIIKMDYGIVKLPTMASSLKTHKILATI